MTILGIDIGLNGGMACLDISSNAVDWTESRIMPMPIIGGKKRHLDLHFIKGWILEKQPELVIIEKVSAMPKQGVSSMFRFGEQFGAIQGICVGLGLPYILVTPQAWKKKVLGGYDKGDKAVATLYVQRKYPNVNLLATSRSRKPHEGMVDAICIAEYGIQNAGE